MNDALPIRLARSGDDGIATLTLCRPDQKNVVNEALANALLEHCATLRSDPKVRCVLLQAEGTMFCAGGDVREMAAHADDLPAHIDRLISLVHDSVLALFELPVPVIACVQGIAAGGGAALAFGSDFTVAARSARFVIAYPQLGTTPDCGLSHTLAQRLGPERGLQVFLGSDELSADQAMRLGLVTQVADDSDTLEAGFQLAARLALLPAPAVAGAKRLFLEGSHGALRTHLDRERLSFLRCAATPEFRDRVLSFAARRHGRS